jgi:RNA-dependent RNA polymerase
MSKLREQTDVLVRSVREELMGDMTIDEWLHRAWVAWKLAILHGDRFGSQSFS